MTTDIIFAIGIMITIGLLGGLLANKFKFPRITGYIIVGVIISPSILNLVPRSTIENWEVMTSIVLAIIGYAIGGSLRMESIRKLGKSVAWITVAETVGALALVTLIITFTGPFIMSLPDEGFLHTYLPVALVIGAAVCPAAPAVTMAVIRELKAKGPLTTTLLAVVALDDALGVIIFSIILGVAKPLMGATGAISTVEMFGHPFMEIIKSIGIGAAFGFAVIGLSRFIKTRAVLLALILGILVVCVGLGGILGISIILVSMVIGFVVRNRISKVKEDEPFAVVEGIEDLAFVVFFVLAGMHFDLAVMKEAGILALLIFGGRFAGKYLGVKISAKISSVPKVVSKYLSFALLPEAGVTIGLALLAKAAFPELGNVLVSGILASVILNELVAPPLTKYAITKAGEAEGAVNTAAEAH